MGGLFPSHTDYSAKIIIYAGRLATTLTSLRSRRSRTLEGGYQVFDVDEGVIATVELQQGQRVEDGLFEVGLTALVVLDLK